MKYDPELFVLMALNTSNRTLNFEELVTMSSSSRFYTEVAIHHLTKAGCIEIDREYPYEKGWGWIITEVGRQRVRDAIVEQS